MNGVRDYLRRASAMMAFAFASLWLAAPTAWSQCQMCREAAASQNQEAILALQNGILILGAPPLAIACGIIWLTYRNRNHFRAAERKDVPPEK